MCYPIGDGSLRQALFCVFDGHGPVGHDVSTYIAAELPKMLHLHGALATDPALALRETFLQVDEKLRAGPIDAEHSGTTAVVCLLQLKADGTEHIYSATAGDSRAVICQHARRLMKKIPKAVALTTDQKADTAGEKERIERNGGFVSPAGEDGPARIWHDAQMIPPGTIVSRPLPPT